MHIALRKVVSGSTNRLAHWWLRAIWLGVVGWLALIGIQGRRIELVRPSTIWLHYLLPLAFLDNQPTPGRLVAQSACSWADAVVDEAILPLLGGITWHPVWCFLHWAGSGA